MDKDKKEEKKQKQFVAFASCQLCDWQKSEPATNILDARYRALELYTTHILGCPVRRAAVREGRMLREALAAM